MRDEGGLGLMIAVQVRQGGQILDILRVAPTVFHQIGCAVLEREKLKIILSFLLRLGKSVVAIH